MNNKKHINLQAEELIFNKQKDLFFKEIDEIITCLSRTDDKRISSNKKVIEINTGQGITRTFGQNCIQINKQGDMFILLESTWQITLIERKKGFSITCISPFYRQFTFSVPFSGKDSLSVSFTLDFQKIIFFILPDGSILLSVIYFLGCTFTPVFNLLLKPLSSRRFLKNGLSSFLQEDINPEDTCKEMYIPPVTLELGKELISLMGHKTKKLFLDRIASIRKHIVMDTGVIVPPVRVKDNFGIKNNELLLSIKDIPVADCEIYFKRFLAIGPETHIQKLRGKKVLDPTYNMPGAWITSDQRSEAERGGCMIFDPVSVIAALLTEVLRKYSFKFLGIQETEDLLGRLLKEYPVVKRELDKVISIVEFNKILKNLLYEHVSIRDLLTICETVIEYAAFSRNTDVLSEYVRQAVKTSLCNEYKTFEGYLYASLIDPAVESFLLASIRRNNKGNNIVIKEHIKEKLFASVMEQDKLLKNKGLKSIIVCSPAIRLYFRRFIEERFPSVTVLSYNEIAQGVSLKPVGMIALDDNLLKECHSSIITGLLNEIDSMGL
ncbi:MAG: FHIPEP family type III secretion protein [Candidatus Eremiobacterota bacterium]